MQDRFPVNVATIYRDVSWPDGGPQVAHPANAVAHLNNWTCNHST